MKKLAIVLGICLLTSVAWANTVDIQTAGIESASINIGNFKLNFLEGNGYVNPPAFDDLFTPIDFTVTWHDTASGGTQPSAALWGPEDVYPITLIGNTYYATGYGAISSNQSNPAAALNDGLVVTLESSSNFGINIDDLANLINPLGDSLTDLVGSTLKLESNWVTADHQVVTISPSAVPIPGALWLLGSGLIGMVGVRRKLNKS